MSGQVFEHEIGHTLQATITQTYAPFPSSFPSAYSISNPVRSWAGGWYLYAG